MVLTEELSLRAKVFQYFRDHPNEVSKRSCRELYNTFKVKSKHDKQNLRSYKTNYKNILFGWVRDQKNKVIDPSNIPTKNRYIPNKKKERFTPSMVLYQNKVKCPHCPGLFANEVMKFVGFRGFKDEDGVCHLDIKGDVYEGEAHPPPIAPVTQNNRANLERMIGKKVGSNVFLGILKYELEVMVLIFFLINMGYVNIVILMPRGHGKTYINAWFDQLDMKYFNQNIMMLSVTNAKLKVGNWIYLWAVKHNYLKNPEKYARINTYQHFELINGMRMDIYDYMDKKLVGEHDVKLVMDDIVSKNWRNKPTDNERAKDQFQSNINYIIRTAKVTFGTRKFEGDPLQYLMEVVEDIIIIIMSPFIECEHGNLNDQGTFDPCMICKDDALLAPELHSHDELMRKMEENYEAWFSEMMQNPHPRLGGMVDDSDLQWVPTRPFFTEVDRVGIGVDCAWTEGETSDMTGIVSMTSSNERREFTVIAQDCGKFPMRNVVKDGKINLGIFERIQRQFNFLKLNYPGKQIIVAIERNDAGKVIIDQARREMGEFTFAKYIVEDSAPAYQKRRAKNPDTPIKLGITHSTEKVARIFGELQHSIKKGKVKFWDVVYGTELITQIVTYPKSRYDDGVDACGMIKDQLNMRHFEDDTKSVRDAIIRQYKDIKKKEYEEAWMKTMAEPWLGGDGGRKTGLRELFER